jgi:hypothetical protein
MKAVQRYALRLERKKYLIRAWRKGRSLLSVADRTDAIRDEDILCFSTLRNERPRLSYFLKYYRDRGVSHFFFVDNDSDDGSREYLAAQPDCSVWTTPESYKRARFGIDWMNRLLRLTERGTGVSRSIPTNSSSTRFPIRGPCRHCATGWTRPR